MIVYDAKRPFQKKTFFSVGYFQNYCHTTKVMFRTLQFFKVLKITLARPNLFIRFNVAHNDRLHIKSLFDRIELRTTEMSMLKAVKNKVKHQKGHVFTSFSMKISPV